MFSLLTQDVRRGTKQLTILISLVAYVIVIGALTIYFAFNLSDYIHWQGDETIHYTYFLLITSIVFQGVIFLIIKQIDWKAAILATIVNFILSYIIGLGILIVLELSGTPQNLILVYGACYITFFTIVTALQSYRANE
jgi:hypothetical protein